MKRVMSFIWVVFLIFAATGIGFAAGQQDSAKADVVTIGLSEPLTGNFAEYGQQFKIACEIAIEEINANGGVKGKELYLKIMDSKGDAKESADIARFFSGEEEVLAVLGDFTSTLCMAAAPIYQESGLTQVSSTASHPDYAPMGDYIFGTSGIQASESNYMVTSTVKKYGGFDSTASLYVNNDWGLLAIDKFAEKAMSENLEITAKEAFVPGETDYTSVLSKLRQTNPECITIFGQYNEVATITKQIKQMGWDIQIILAGSSCTDQYIQLVGDDSEGIISQLPFFFEEENEMQMAFYNEFEKRAGFPPTVFAIGMYDAINMLAVSIDDAPELNRKSVRDSFANYKGFSGIMGPIVFSPQGDVARDYRIGIVENGKWVAKTGYGY